MSINNLPPDCLLQILTNLSVEDFLRLGCVCKTLNEATKDDEIWRALAERKWGHWAKELAHVDGGEWERYCRHRISFFSLAPSPLDLIQEQYLDPWRHLACCILCSRTTGSPVVRRAIARLLEVLPSPSAVLDASKDALWELLHPLGLQAVRCSALKTMSRDFLEKDWQDPQEFKGCGKFVSDSWRIFCRGLRSARGVEDSTLLRYLRWLGEGVATEKGGRKSKASTGAVGSKRRREAASKAEDSGGSGDQHWLRSRARRSTNSSGSGTASGRLHHTPSVPDRRVTRSAAKAR